MKFLRICAGTKPAAELSSSTGTMNRNIVVVGATILVLALGGVIALKRHQASRSALLSAKAENTPKSSVGMVRSIPPETPPASTASALPEPAALPNLPTKPARPEIASPAAPNQKPAKPPKDPLTDPLARVALSLVGADLDAEIYWMAAINDPTHPPGERKDLIEDLNEEGFADPKHPAPEELPLIMSRIALIEDLWPWAADKTNWEAFQEAYKDLWNMYDLAQGGGDPVK